MFKTRLTNFNIIECEDIIESIMFGFPSDKNNTIIIDFCIIHARYFIYQNKIKNDNKIEFLPCLSLLKKWLLIEKLICIAHNQEHKFTKFNPVLEIV